MSKETIYNDIKEKIYSLRKQGLTYSSITLELNREGKRISSTVVSKYCKLVFKEKGEVEPVLDNTRRIVLKNEFVEQIRYLREVEGLAFYSIAVRLNRNGIQISDNTVKKIYNEKYKNTSQAEENIREVLEKLKKLKGATPEQLKILADLYGVEFNGSPNIEDTIPLKDIGERI